MNLKGSASSSSISSLSINEANLGKRARPNELSNNKSYSALSSEFNFETFFKTTYPWQSVFIPQNVDKSIEEVRLFIFVHLKLLKLNFQFLN